ncbi:hypothetical protein DNHGIG_39810 [Collibacillus ludicampi]|uniref:Lysine biosynthesis protein LysW n=1 Tax=Collibacillus ludicampi TaxID=2771369 RepID=A0AAV4LN09_9BACL|nr:hypothetical protein [Collibacillus ludicampi]GIM48432.1 hypothetical protein DNHGIG_39810 [Collibacillus ludicampi]
MQGIEMHLYCCKDCNVLFGIETAFEDQSVIVCPVCQSDENLLDGGTGLVEITRQPEVWDE